MVKNKACARLIAALFLATALAILPACSTVSSWFGGDTPAEQAKTEAMEHWDKAMGHKASGDKEGAAAELELAIKSDPAMYQAYYQLGLVYQDLNHPELARQAWEYGLAEARKAPERPDYPREQAIAEMQAALAGLEHKPTETEIKPTAGEKPASTQAPMPPAAKPAAGAYAVLYSSNLKKYNAVEDMKKLKALGYDVTIKQHKDKKGRNWHRVWVGCCVDRAGAKLLADSMRKKGLTKKIAIMRP